MMLIFSCRSLRLGGLIAFAFVCLILAALPATAQETVTDDEVNIVAARMYCPECEFVPLDDCGTPACIQWKREIRAQLEAGRTSDEIVADFVQRYGDRVVGTPQDPLLRAISLVTPWILAVLAVTFGIRTLLRLNQRKAITDSPQLARTLTDDDYRARLERDLQARR
jgi:cytochrome c-type biogenesis protein CcmH